ncbi:hypothetical protein AGOR_G00153730 [Albula goreensis]|uniref:DNA2/NAM7 helicase helicase domain-containing protein n=1 Tax=Albula goreensis TaxID=1534307 RepID=A0A8T3D3B0_9TELE|nr:hypothetical protein AGOR_G00153730 [Albula goreensis]
MMLMWKRRVYSINTSKTFVELQRLYCNNPCTDVPHEAWRDIVEALRMEKWETAMSIILSTETQKTNTKASWKSGNVTLKNAGASGQEDSTGGLTQIEMEHYVKLPLNLKPGDILQVQMTTEIQQGLLMPTVQLLNINEKFEVCLNHAHSPVDCFATYAQQKTQTSYRDVQDYARIWKPLCEMESASTAVDDSESIVIEDLELSWTKEQEGSFLLSDTCIKDWAIECNLGKCYMCIRKRDIKQPAVDQSEEQVDPCSFTWVAHGVTTGYSETKKGVKSTKVSFDINHLPMENIPVCVYQKNTKFTVELIPKLTPDVRKEIAVNSLKFSNDLVKKIVLGHRIPGGDSECLIPKRKIMRRAPPKGLPALNESQYTAVEEALKNKFTLIQGPPGTGKTVVGAYIVYWFLELNSLKPRHHEDPKDQNKRK